MSNLLLVSIVLPTHNGQQFLAQSIRSCLEQTYRLWELVVVDDGSTDSTPQILTGFEAQDSRIRVIRHAENSLLPAALNTGMKAAQGDLLTWTSDDNGYQPEAIERMVRVLEKAPDVDIVYTDFTRIDAAGQPLSTVKAPPIERLAFHNCVGPCFLYRRAVHERLCGYAEELFLAEDYDFWLRAAQFFHFEPLHEDLYLYREHKGSLSAQRLREINVARAKTLSRHLGKLDWMPGDLRAQSYWSVARSDWGRKDLTAMGRHLYKSFRSSTPAASRLFLETTLRRKSTDG